MIVMDWVRSPKLAALVSNPCAVESAPWLGTPIPRLLAAAMDCEASGDGSAHTVPSRDA